MKGELLGGQRLFLNAKRQAPPPSAPISPPISPRQPRSTSIKAPIIRPTAAGAGWCGLMRADASYYRDCSNYGAGWARMGGHGHQMRLVTRSFKAGAPSCHMGVLGAWLSATSTPSGRGTEAAPGDRDGQLFNIGVQGVCPCNNGYGTLKAHSNNSHIRHACGELPGNSAWQETTSEIRQRYVYDARKPPDKAGQWRAPRRLLYF